MNAITGVWQVEGGKTERKNEANSQGLVDSFHGG